MKIYIDFDGVIMDSEKHLFDGLENFKKDYPEADDFLYVSTMNWEKYLNETSFIEGSIEFLQNNPNVIILTKVCSLTEAKAKIDILRNNGVLCDVILVPYGMKKCNIVNAYHNILIDDTVHNLDDWQEQGGISVYFNKNNNILDPWKKINDKYIMIDNLNTVKRVRK